MTGPHTTATSAPSLVAIAIAARRSRDRRLERAARRELERGHGIAIRFVRRRRKEGT
jgi:hypothetical protein